MSTIIIGDIDEGIKWWSAVNFLKLEFARIHGGINPYMTTWKYLDSDVKVFIKLVAGKPQAFIYTEGGIYLESGFIATGGVSSEYEYNEPARLYAGISMAPYLASTDFPLELLTKRGAGTQYADSPFFGKQITDGMLSKSVALLKDETNDYLVYRKQMLQNVPASLYTGKLQLFLQSVYGAKRFDYATTVGSYGEKRIRLNAPGEFTFEYRGIESAWLYTTPDYNYYVCHIVDGNIEMIPVILTTEAKKFRDGLLVHPNNDDFHVTARIEAYILAYATLDTENALSVAIPGYSVLGYPIAYGWHANWQGDELNVVTIRTDANVFKSNHYRLTLTATENVDGGYDTTAALAHLVSDEAFCLRISDINLYYFNEYSRQMERLPEPYAGEDWEHPPFNFDVPVYCMMLPNAVTGVPELVILRASRDLTLQSDYTEDNTPSRWDSLGDGRVFLSNTYSGYIGKVGLYTTDALGTPMLDSRKDVVHTYSSITQELFFDYLDDSFDHAGTMQYYPYPYDNSPTWAEDAGYIPETHPIHKKTVGGNNYYATRRSNRAYFTLVTTTNSGSYTEVKAVAEFPLGACESAIIGTTTRSKDPVILANATTGYWAWMDKLFRHDPEDSYSGAVTADVVAAYTGSVHARNFKSAGFPFFHATTGGFVVPPTYPDEIYETKFMDIIANEHGTVGLSTIADGDDRYFYPIKGLVYLGAIDTARGTIQSGARINHTLYSGSYGFIHEASVGWA